MFAPRAWFEKLTSVYDHALERTHADSERAVGRIIAAKQAEIDALLSIHATQKKFLEEQVADLRGQVMHERARAEAAIDRLLEQEKIHGVRHADLERKVTEANAEKEPIISPEKLAEVNRVFSEVNSVGEDEGRDNPMERLTMVGGMAVD